MKASNSTQHTLDPLQAAQTQRSEGQPPCSPKDASNSLVATLDWAHQAGMKPPIQSETLAEALGLPYVHVLSGRRPAGEFLRQFPISFARKHGLMVFIAANATENDTQNDTLEAAIADLPGWSRLDTVSRCLGRSIKPFFAPASEIQNAVNVAYQQQSGQTQSLIDSLDREEVLADLEQLHSRQDLLDVAGHAPVVKLVNLILFEAVKSRASDVHVHPYENRLVVRLRVDGVLFDAFDVPKNIQEEVISRFKVVGQMDIAEKRLPQDGRATVRVGDRQIDLRIASLPTSFGERVVVRLLDKSAQLHTLSELGMDAVTHAKFSELIHREHGLILVTGPTGSGKSTTLYAALQEVNAVDRNVITLEDPIEYQIEGISQTQINEKKGMTFAKGLRNVLRQDPDIIMVGEIRDHETAVMAIQSALTGHLVFSTLHTNDASSAVTRMLDLGIEPYLLSSCLMAAMAQRLVRKTCASCSAPYAFRSDDFHKLGITPEQGKDFVGRQGAGCAECRGTGYRGRVGLFELLLAESSVRRKINTRASATEIRDDAVRHGMRLLREDGLDKIRSGETTVDEVVRVTVQTGS